MNVRRLLVLSLLLLSMTSIVTAQPPPGTLTGTVVTFSTGGQTTPLQGATLTLIRRGDAPRIEISDAQGRYQFSNLRPGTYHTKAQLHGFGETTAIAEIYNGKTTTQTINLRAMPASREKKKE